MTLGLCQWYYASNSNPLEFKINSSGIKLISNQFRHKVSEFDQGKRVQLPGLSKFMVEVESEVSDVESPHFKEVVGDKATKKATSGASKAPAEEEESEEEEEEEEVEEENPDVHFNPKWKEPARSKPHKK